MCIVLFLIVNFVKFIASIRDSNTYQGIVKNAVIGECVSLSATTYFQSNTTQIHWLKDTKPLVVDDRRITIQQTTLKFHPVTIDDAAYYQVIVKDDRFEEITEIWLNVKGCKKSQKEVSRSIEECLALCEDVCPSDWVYVPGTTSKCVKYFAELKTWEEASEKCQSLGAELVTVLNHNQNQFIADELQSGSGAWIGLNDRINENTYVWNFNDRPSSFYAWGADEPSNYNRGCNIENCVIADMRDGMWRDVVCPAYKTFVCQVHASHINGSNNEGWRCTGNKCLRYFDEAVVWEDALQTCHSVHSSGGLVQIDNRAESALVTSLLWEDAWIGLNDIWEAGEYKWNENTPSDLNSFANWAPREPNDKFYSSFDAACPGEDCVQLQKFGSKVTWHDLGCQTHLPYVCERVRERAVTTGSLVAIVIGALIACALIAGSVQAAIARRKKMAVKDIVKAVQRHDRKTSSQQSSRDQKNK